MQAGQLNFAMIQTSLSGKVAVGAKVLVADISSKAAQELSSQLSEALALECDVTSEASVGSKEGEL